MLVQSFDSIVSFFLFPFSSSFLAQFPAQQKIHSGDNGKIKMRSRLDRQRRLEEVDGIRGDENKTHKTKPQN